MLDEIREIRDYISCPQFGDDYYGKWGTLRLDQRIKIKDLIDYITNLQEENERLQKLLDFEIERNYLKQERIEKAIEYMKKVINENEEWDMYRENKLLNILEGEK